MNVELLQRIVLQKSEISLIECILYVRTSVLPNLGKSRTAVCLGSPGRCLLITCDIHRPLWLVSVYGELKWLSGGTLRQADLLSWTKDSNSCRKNIGLLKLSSDSFLYLKVVESRGILSFYTKIRLCLCYKISFFSF